MSLNHSPSTVTDGLVLYYDMSNTKKSFKGAPATNMYADGDFAAMTTHSVNSGSTKTFIPDPRNATARVLKFSAYGAGTQYHGRDITAVVSSVYSFQMEIYVSSDFDGTSVAMYPEQGGSGASVNYNLTSKGTWQTLKYNGKVASTTNIRLLAYVLSTSTTGYVLVANVQCELSPITTPFTSSTRSNTQSLLDLTGLNTLTATSLTYAADNTFSFDGTAGYIDCGNPVNFDLDFTCSLMIKSSAYALTKGILVKTDPGSYSTTKGFSITNISNPQYVYIWISDGTTTTNLSTNLGSYGWTMLTVTRNINTIATYINGIYLNGVSLAGLGSIVGSQNLFLGTGNNGKWPGEAPLLQLYNRALSAAEVRQNFNAIRGRYGL